MFNKFKGIQKEREIKEEEKGRFEHLVKIGGRIVKDHTGVGNMHYRYDIVYKELKHDLLRDFEFDEEDLRSFVYAAHTNEYNGQERIVLGAYSGCLLHLLTERNKSKGHGTRFYIDGKGIKFPGLFSFAKEVDELIIENFKGRQICSYLASNIGSVNLVIGRNIEGENAFSSIAADKGRASIVAGINIKGDGALLNIGKHGLTGLVLGSGIEGKKSLSSVGEHGVAGIIVGNDITGEYPFDGTGNYGNVDMLICNKFKGHNISCNVGFSGSIKLMLAKDINQKSNISSLLSGREIKKILYEQDTGPIVYDARKMCAEKSREEYDSLLKEYNLDEILKLIDMKEKSIEETITDLRKIRELYKSVEEKFKNDVW